MEENLVCWDRTQQTMMEETDAFFWKGNMLVMIGRENEGQ